jgi:hypothetical protein
VLRLYHDALVSAEYREGIEAFLAKRPADFRAARRTESEVSQSVHHDA